MTDRVSSSTKDFDVSGYAFIPVKIKLTVTSDSPKAAMKQAEKIFKTTRRKSDLIEDGSEDFSSVFGFYASEAKS